MAIGDITRRVLTRFEADTSQYAKELQKAGDQLKDHGKGIVEWGKTLNDGINTGIEKLGSLGLAFNGLREILDFSKEAIREWGKDLRLEATTAGISIEKLKDAVHGMVDDDTLREFAAKTMGGQLKLTQQQMEQMGQAALALTSRGYDLAESLHKLEEAAVSGRTRGLGELGIKVEEGASKFETLKNLMNEVNKTIKEVGPHIDTEADQVDRLAAKWADAWKNAKNYTAAALGAVVGTSDYVRKDETTIGALQRYMGEEGSGWNAFLGGIESGRAIGRGQQYGNFLSPGFRQSVAAGARQVQDSMVIDMPELNLAQSDAERKKAAEDAARRAAFSILHSAIASVDRNLASLGPTGDLARARDLQRGYSVASSTSLGEKANTTQYDEFGAVQDEQALVERASAGVFTRNWYDRLAKRQKQESYLESQFGKIEDFQLYATAFSTLSTAVTSSMQAWISGSLSLGEAIKKGIGQALAGLASQMAVESLKHVAYAIGSLAFGDFAGAGRHGAAAAAFGAASVAAAVAARELGGGGKSASAAANAGAGAAAGGIRPSSSGTGAGSGSGTGGSTQYIIVYGENFFSQSNRMRQLDAQRFVKKAMGGGDVQHS